MKHHTYHKMSLSDLTSPLLISISIVSNMSTISQQIEAHRVFWAFTKGVLAIGFHVEGGNYALGALQMASTVFAWVD